MIRWPWKKRLAKLLEEQRHRHQIELLEQRNHQLAGSLIEAWNDKTRATIELERLRARMAEEDA